MLNMGCNYNMEQDDEQRVRSRRAHDHPKDFKKTDGSIPEIPDHVLESDWKKKFKRIGRRKLGMEESKERGE